ncbi:MAG: 50S ribosomal protein L11 methyltransferase [Candidatus Thorarchaeota archaeon]
MKPKKYATPFAMLHVASLLGQKSRLKKFKQAIDLVVKNGDYVVDIGTGTGILAILAAKAGAAQVTAIEVNPESIQYATHAARLNGVESIIEFFEGSFHEFVPKKRADVVVCEMLSSMMLVEQQIPASHYAKQNILKPEGIILPQEVCVYIVPVECPGIWDRFLFDGLQFPRVIQTATPDVTRDMADMQILATFSLSDPGLNRHVKTTLEFSTIAKGTIHGFVGVFESKLYDDILLNMEDGWKQLFIPLQKPIAVDVNDTISVRIEYQPGVYDSLSLEVL